MLAAVSAAMRIEWAPHAHAARERMRDGIDFLARDHELAPVVGIVFVSLLLMTATPAAALFFADDNLHMGGAGYGILMATWGAGMALGALVVAPRFRLGSMACVAVAAVAAQGLGIAVPALWPMVWLAIAGYLFGGISHGTKNVLARTLIHAPRARAAPRPRVRGVQRAAQRRRARRADAGRDRDQRARRALDARLRRRRAGCRGVRRPRVDAGAGAAGAQAGARAGLNINGGWVGVGSAGTAGLSCRCHRIPMANQDNPLVLAAAAHFSLPLPSRR